MATQPAIGKTLFARADGSPVAVGVHRALNMDLADIVPGTLQELLAPNEVEFWSRDGQRLGTKHTLKDLIHEITEIPLRALCGVPLSDFSVNERHRWAAKRDTTRKEDKAYCLLGIFDVFMPPMYGEGDHASQRLLDKIKLRFGDVQPDSGNRAGANYESLEGHRESVLASLQFEQMDTRRSTVKDAQQKTCAWMVQHPAYVAWRLKEGCSEEQRTLWIAGKPGAGKSTIMKYLHNNTNEKKHDDEIVISFFFNARGDELEKTTVGMYRALLAQILVEVQDLQNLLDERDPSSEWTVEALKCIIADAINGLGGKRLTCFIDALDECDEQQIRDMIDFFDDVRDNTHGPSDGLFICFASRHYPTIEIRSGQRLVLEDEDGHFEDLWKYIRRRLKAGKGKPVDDIQAQVHEKANGVFMWVVLVINILNDEFSRGRIFAVKQRLKEIPSDLSDLFRDLLRRDNVHMDDLLLCIQWILFARRPLSMQEFYFAMVAGLYPEQAPEAWNQEEVASDHMRLFVQSSSKGLAELTKSKTAPQVQFIHESVNDFLLKDGGLQELWPEMGEPEQLYYNSHERLKCCCLHQLTADYSTSTSMNFTEALPRARTEEAKKLRAEMSAGFPFAAYASSEILFHANEAAHHIAQENFLESFPLSSWVYMNNIYESHQVRRHSLAVTLLYVLAENGLNCLIRSSDTTHLWRQLEDERYLCPIVAAFCNGHTETLFMLVGTREDVGAYEITFDPGFGRPSLASKTGDILLWATDQGNWAFAEMLLVHCPQGAFSTHPLKRKHNSDDALSIAARHGKVGILRQLLPCELRPIHLISACEGGNVGVVELLLNHGADVNAEHSEPTNPSQYCTALEAAAAENHESLVQLLVDRGVNMLAQRSALAAATHRRHIEATEILLQRGARFDREGMCSALLTAAECGLQRMFELILEYSDSVSPPIDDTLRMALGRASAVGHERIVKLILDKFTEMTIETSNDALLNACRGGFEQIVQLLLEHGADANARDSSDVNALGTACCKGYYTIVQLLLDYGADANARNGPHGIDLTSAHASGQDTILRLLLDHGADVNAQNRLYDNTLIDACINGHEAIARLLLDRGADVNARGGIYGNALNAACVNGHKTVARLLLDYRPDMNAETGMYVHAFFIAYRSGHRAIARLLLDYRPNMNAETGMYGHALFGAYVDGYEAIMRLLLEGGADLHTFLQIHNTALIHAIRYGHETIVQLLLDYGADVNASSEIYGTALGCACRIGHETILRLLLDHGADINARDLSAETALEIALRTSSESVVRLLRERGAVDGVSSERSRVLPATSACLFDLFPSPGS